MVSRKFAEMKARGLMKDEFHYYQQAYNEVYRQVKIQRNISGWNQNVLGTQEPGSVVCGWLLKLKKLWRHKAVKGQSYKRIKL